MARPCSLTSILSKEAFAKIFKHKAMIPDNTSSKNAQDVFGGEWLLWRPERQFLAQALGCCFPRFQDVPKGEGCDLLPNQICAEFCYSLALSIGFHIYNM